VIKNGIDINVPHIPEAVDATVGSLSWSKQSINTLSTSLNSAWKTLESGFSSLINGTGSFFKSLDLSHNTYPTTVSTSTAFQTGSVIKGNFAGASVLTTTILVVGGVIYTVIKLLKYVVSKVLHLIKSTLSALFGSGKHD